MNSIKEIKEKYALNPQRYTIKNGITIIDTNNGRLVFKKNKGNSIKELYKYLKTRNFEHYIPLIETDDRFNIYNYIEEVDVPLEQKALDLMFILSLLHNKTTYYKEVDIDDYKKIYEEINNNIDYYYKYFSALIEQIETKVYMSPAEYLLARNISKIYLSLSFCKTETSNWYQLIKGKRKQRVVMLHNNLELDHLLVSDGIYLTSWENYKVDMPIYDIYNLYKKHYFDLDFFELLKIYENKYPLLLEERKLLFVLITMPDKIEFTENHYLDCKLINKYLDYIYKTEELILNYYTTNKVEENTKFNK